MKWLNCRFVRSVDVQRQKNSMVFPSKRPYSAEDSSPNFLPKSKIQSLSSWRKETSSNGRPVEVRGGGVLQDNVEGLEGVLGNAATPSFAGEVEDGLVHVDVHHSGHVLDHQLHLTLLFCPINFNDSLLEFSILVIPKQKI